MDFVIDMKLVYNIIAIAALMVCNTILRIAVSVKIEDFDYRELLKGLLKYLLTLCGVVFFYVAGQFCPEAGLEINGELVTIDIALNILSLGLIGVYTVKCFENLRDIFSDTGLVLAKMAAKHNRAMAFRKEIK